MEHNICEQLYLAFYRAGYLLKRKDVVGIPVTPGQLRLLHKISPYETLSQRDLQDMVQVRPASLSAMLLKLENNGYLQRTRDLSDKRNMQINLTKDGKELVEEFYFKQNEISQEAFSCLTFEEQEQLKNILVKLIENWRPQDE